VETFPAARKKAAWASALIAVLLSLAVVLTPGAYAAGDDETEQGDKYAKPPKLAAKSAILINARTGDVLYEKKADVKRLPASCTKIMTVLLAIENLGPDEVVTVTDEAYGVEGSSVGLVPDEEVRAEDLFYAALLESGNDAATALAVGVDGSIEEFAARMNERVQEMGLDQSHFANPHGLDHPEHYTTARNLAYIAREAMLNENFRKYVSTYEYIMPKTNIQPKRILHNSNRMLYEEGKMVDVYGESVKIKYPDVTGIKTGYTSKAGNCLVSGVSRNGLELISVVLKSKGMNQYSDSMSLLEYGLHNFEEVTFMKKGDTMFESPVVNSDQTSMNLILSDDLTLTVNKLDRDAYDVDGEITAQTTEGGLLAPINAGDVLGQAWVKGADGQAILTVDLVAENSMGPKKDDPIIADDGVGALSLILRVIGVVCLIAVVIVVIAIIRAAFKRRKRRRNRMYGAKLNSSVDPREVRRIKNINGPNRRR
jgi:D-alanyl-D-alanine carboxypeptidase (penicillin-binding protein 5/6)